MIALWLLACATTSEVPVHPASDVPAPPGQVSLEVGPMTAVGEPGDVVVLDGVPAEIVDIRGAVWTVYVAEGAGERWLDAGSVHVARSGCR